MSFGTDYIIRSLEERRKNNSYHIDRLLDLCTALTQRMTESGSEIDEIRSELAKYQSQMIPYTQDNNEVAKQLHELRSRSGV